MSKSNKKKPIEIEEVSTTTEQAVSSESDFAKNDEDLTASTHIEDVQQEPNVEQTQVEVKKQSSGKGIALLALLVALGIGGAGYYFGSQKLNEVEAQLKNLAIPLQAPVNPTEMPSFEAEKAQLAQLSQDYQAALERIKQLEANQQSEGRSLTELQLQLQKVNSASQNDESAWLLSDADFLLTNAQRKMVLDNDLATTRQLLLEADSVLAKVVSPHFMAVREAIKADLKNLDNVNEVDQNALMQRLTTLANNLDDLPVFDNGVKEEQANNEVSDSLQDWQQNIEKSAGSFLNHFIRVSDRNKAEEKAFVAPNQEIYLRENIRLRLQIAILAIPRQQNELYKQSLEAVSSWVRSYFDTQNENVKAFLKELDNLAEQSVYIDAPTTLQSLVVLDKMLNKTPNTVEKIEIEAEKQLEQPAKDAEPQPNAPQPNAQ